MKMRESGGSGQLCPTIYQVHGPGEGLHVIYYVYYGVEHYNLTVLLTILPTI